MDWLMEKTIKKLTKKIKLFFLFNRFLKTLILGICLFNLSSCANFKRTSSQDSLSVANLEPSVSFVDKKEIEVKPSTIESVQVDKVIQSYERLLNRGNPKIRQEALHRLANIYMDLAESKSTNEDIDDKSEQNQVNSNAYKQASFAKAISLYQQLLQEFPTYAQNDEIKYQLARAHSLNANPEEALKVLDYIATTHTESTSYVESQFRRGESYFIRKQYKVAEKAYAEVISKGNNSEFYDKALYKRGWSFFKQDLYAEALIDFFELYEKLQEQRGLQNSNNKLIDDLLKDTQRVVSLSFYNMDGAESAKNYFQKNGHKDYEDKIYNALASLFVEQERFKDAADTYFSFIDSNPLSLSSPEFHSKVIGIYKKGGFPSLILPAKEKFVVNYGRKSAFWNKYSGKVIDDIKPLLRQHLDDISAFYHAKAQKSKKPKDFIIAANWYKEILSIIDLNELALDSRYRFLLAESLSDANQFETSAQEYEVVAYTNPQTQYSRDAAYRALVAYQKVIHPKEATQLEKLLPSIQSGEKFSQSFSSDSKAPEILARVAEQQLIIKDVAAAIKSSRQLLVLPAKANRKQINRANIIIANGLFDLKRYQEAEVAINQALNSGLLSQPEVSELRQRRVESIYKLAEKAQAANELPQAVELFLKVKQLEPQSKIAANAHFDAATLLIELKDWTQATHLLESFRAAYPRDPLVQSIPEKLVLIHEKQENWSKAAQEYQKLAENQKDPELARAGFWKVAELYLKAKNNTKAIDAFKSYVWKYPAPYLFAQEGQYHLVQLYNKVGDSSKALFWRQKIVDSYYKNPKQNNIRTSFLAAESKYLLSENLFIDYKRIKLKLPLKTSLKKKRAAMKKSLDAYNQIAQFKVAQFTTASTHKIAQIYQILSQDLMASQKPKGLSEDELEEYGFLLEEQALPFEDKAINYFEINAQRTKEKVYDASVKESIESLKKLKPVQYDKSEQLKELSDVDF